jgi:ribosome-binding protein aMBF1 (putative translation factor)
MTATPHTSWKDYKRGRPLSPEGRAAYDRAGQAIQLGERVRELREARGISRAELARLMGTTRSVIERLELGGAEPRLDTLYRVSRALDLDLVIDFRPRATA